MLARLILLAIACAVAGGYLMRIDLWAAWLAFAGAAALLVYTVVLASKQLKVKRIAARA